MKNLMLAVFIFIGIASCSPEPNNLINDTKTEQVGFAVEKVGEKPVMKYEEYYLIAPTWKQANYYASKRNDHNLYLGIGLVFFVSFIAVLVGKTADASWLPKSIDNPILGSLVLFLLLVASVYFMTSHQTGIKWNNDKWVKKELFDKNMKESGSIKPIWDSLEANCLIVDGPYNCK